jgi:hypothetical protein
MNNLIHRMRTFELDHAPDGWPAVQMRDITALCDALEDAIHALTAIRAAAENHFHNFSGGNNELYRTTR